MNLGSKTEQLFRHLKNRTAPPSRWRLPIVAVILVAGVVVLTLFKQARAIASVDPAGVTPPTVAVASVDCEDLYQELTVPAEFRPYQEVELHAKVSGYLQQMNVDFGDEVRTGQLLATLEVPELKNELDSAVAAVNRAEADYKDAHLTCTRLQAVNREHPNLVAQQDLDTAQAKDDTTSAALASMKAEVEKYQTLIAYTKIIAPFDGVITRRYADPGALIQSGTASDTQSLPLVRLSDNYRLRLDFPVSVDYIKYIQPDNPVKVRIDSLGGRIFTGKISRCTQRVEATTRTMMVEMEVPNPKLDLVPGMYASVVLKVAQRPHVLAIPTQAVVAGKATVFVVNAQHKIEERKVILGLETPAKYEVLSGLKEGDLVVIGDSIQFKPREKVEPKEVRILAEQ